MLLFKIAVLQVEKLGLGLSMKCPVKIPYSGKFSLVQIFAEKRADSSEEILAVFIFADAGLSGHTPTS